MNDAKEFFLSIRNIDAQIDVKLQHLATLKALAVKVTASSGGEVVSSTSSGRSLENAVAKIIDLEHEIDVDIDAYVGLKRTAMKIISELPNEKHRRVLTERYLCGKTFEAVAVDMGYSYFGICRLHGAALAEANKIIQKNFQV